jgi:uncharacterized protein
MMPAGALPVVRKLSLAAILLAFFAGTEGAPAQEITFPSLTGRVVDEAGLLDAALRTEIEAKLAALEEKTTDQLVVVTVRSLAGRTIEDYGNRLFRAWAIGQKDKNNGVLLVVAPNERKVRIEVGYGLEGALPDAIASLIIQNSILPRFKANDYPGGIASGVDEIIKVLSGERREQPVEPKKNPTTLFGLIGLVAPFLFSGPGLVLLVILIHFLFVLLLNTAVWLHLAKPRPHRSSPWSWSSSGPGWSSGSSSWSGSDSGGFSGGGGSSGGGGASGSW